MISGAAIAREVDEIAEGFTETIANLQERVGGERLTEFAEETTDALKALEKQKLIATHLSDEEIRVETTPQVPSALSHINNLVVLFDGGLALQDKQQLRKVRNNAERVYRKLQMLHPNSQGELVSSVYWISQQGLDQDIDLLFKVKRRVRFLPDEVIQAFDFGQRSMISKRWPQLCTFFELTASEMSRVVDATIESYRDSESSYLKDSFHADRATTVLQALKDIQSTLMSHLDYSRIKEWLNTRLPAFKDITAREALMKGQTLPLLHLVKRMTEGT